MKLLLLQIDKTQDSYIAEGTGIYLKRLKNYTQLDTCTISMPKNFRHRAPEEQKTGEAALLLEQILPGDHVVLLDEKGKTFTSTEFAAFIGKKQLSSLKRLVFVIGGPYGFHASLYARANEKLALSSLTFSHQMVRLFFTEQLYRAFTIIKGEKYHHQ